MTIWIHPAIQALAALAAAYALFLGGKRFASLHLGRRTMFPKKKHIRTGSAAHTLWAVGIVVGIVQARLDWGGFFLSGSHARGALAFALILIIAHLSGRALQKSTRPRKTLAAGHALANLLLLVLAFIQLQSGRMLLP